MLLAPLCSMKFCLSVSLLVTLNIMFIASINGFCGDCDADQLIYLEAERNKVKDKI